LSAEIAQRLGDEDPSGVRARLAAATFLAALRVSVHVWLDQPPGVRLWDLVRESLTQAGRGFA
jgi:hypothetical protein